jgi:radical SAM superfamily enzyme YgiQ (UPF0313 family)
MKKPLVYMADLRYNYSGVLANDCMPVNVGYLKAVMDRDLPEVESRLFVYPDRLWDAIEQRPPDVLMLSNYMWCEALSCHFGKLAKRVNPNTLVVMGGPNIPIEDERQIQFLAERPEIDVYILGEGDFLATEITRYFLDAGMSIPELGKRKLPSSLYRRPDGQVVLEKMWDRHKEIDEIPSPWLTGLLDEFFDGKLAPLLETNRGCPFTCTFCVQGTRWYTKVHNFTIERVCEELAYIARRIHQVCPNMGTLRIADSNYGMFERDVEISGYIGRLQKQYGWPLYIDATTGKNRPDRIIKSVEAASGALVLYQAVQSLDENVLRNIKRTTIKLEAYEQLQIHMRGRGLRSNSDLILGLPGETLDTHLAAMRKLLDAGVDQVTNFQLMLLKGSELETVETRNMFSFDSRFRILYRNFGVYGGEKVLDVEEIAVATDTLTFEDYVKARKYALAGFVFWRHNWFEDVVKFVGSLGVKRSEWLDAMVEAMDSGEEAVRQLVDDFERETREELFPSREACIEFYSHEENWQKLISGEIGDNLLRKYQAKASFHIWPDVCRVAMQATARLLEARGLAAGIPDFENFWANLTHFLEHQHAWGWTAEEVMAPRRAALGYDIGAWLEAGAPADLSAYRLEAPEEFEFRLTGEGEHGLSSTLQVWGMDLKALVKVMNRIQPGWQVRKASAVAETSDAAGGAWYAQAAGASY